MNAAHGPARKDPDAIRAGLERLIVWHLWACAPFAVPWLLFPDVFGRATARAEIFPMRILFLVIGLSLVFRTWVILKRIKGLPWSHIWPLLDIVFITVGGRIGYAEPDSWIVAVYFLPVLQAAATLDLRWSIGVAALGAVACGSIGGFENLIYSYFLFRLALLVLAASLVTQLARGLVKARTRLELAQYRSELASEMHDGLQQYLGAIAMKMEVAERSPEHAREAASSVKDVARQASDELRLMLHRLRSPLLGKGSLEEGLKYLAALVSERSPLEVAVAVEGTHEDLPPKVEHALLRIAQEALWNVVKHANASRAAVTLSFEPSQIHLTVLDDGTGLPDQRAGQGIGMETMKNRAESVGAQLGIRRAPGGGTSVEVIIPRA